MSRNLVLVFVFVHVCIVVLQIKKHTNVIDQFYKKQRNEKSKQELLQKKSALLRNLYLLKNPASIKRYAADKLNMQKIALNQIVKLPEYEK